MTTPNTVILRPSRIATYLNYVMILICLIEIALVFSDISDTLRLVLACAIFICGPGSALVQWLSIEEPPIQVMTIFALSVAATLLMSQSLLAFHNLSAELTSVLFLILTLARPLPGSRWTKPRSVLIHSPDPHRNRIRTSLFGKAAQSLQPSRSGNNDDSDDFWRKPNSQESES